jgi:LysM repeat protein
MFQSKKETSDKIDTSAPTERKSVCPFLGLPGDTQTYFYFPNLANCCNHTHPPNNISIAHQAKACLGPNFKTCPVFPDTWSGPLPEELCAAGKDNYSKGSHWRTNVFVVVGMVVLAVVVFLLGWHIVMGSFPGSANSAPGGDGIVLPAHTPTPANQTVITPITLAPYQRTIKKNPIPSRTATVNPTLSPTETQYASPTPGPKLEMTISSELPFLIHRVVQGDSLSLLALRYHTSIAAIKAINGLGDDLLVDGQYLVIPVGVSDPTLLPVFVVYQVEDNGESLQDIAAKFQADVNAIRYYNNLGNDPILPGGRWLIIPLTSGVTLTPGISS